MTQPPFSSFAAPQAVQLGIPTQAATGNNTTHQQSQTTTIQALCGKSTPTTPQASYAAIFDHHKIAGCLRVSS